MTERFPGYLRKPEWKLGSLGGVHTLINLCRGCRRHTWTPQMPLDFLSDVLHVHGCLLQTQSLYSIAALVGCPIRF